MPVFMVLQYGQKYKNCATKAALKKYEDYQVLNMKWFYHFTLQVVGHFEFKFISPSRGWRQSTEVQNAKPVNIIPKPVHKLHIKM